MSRFLRTAMLLLASSAGAASAQQRLRLERFRPASPGGVLASEGPVDGELLRAALWVSWSQDPLRVHRVQSGRVGDVQTEVVASMITATASVSGRIAPGFELVADASAVPWIRGEADDELELAPERGGVGDLRIGLRARLLGRGALSLGASGWLRFSTANGGRWTGDDSLGGELRLHGSAALERGRILLNLGARIAPVHRIANLSLGPQVRGSVAGEVFLPGGLSLVSELETITGLASEAFFAEPETAAEFRLGASLRIRRVVVGAALGAGLIRGYGAPRLRVMLTVASGMFRPAARGASPVSARGRSAAATTRPGEPQIRSTESASAEPSPVASPPRPRVSTPARGEPPAARLPQCEPTGVYFATDRAALTPQSWDTLRQVAELAPRSVRVVGHADVRGSDDHNDLLSLRRARAVAEGLRTLGVRAMLDLDYRGRRAPAGPGRDPVSLAMSRRVDVLICRDAH